MELITMKLKDIKPYPNNPRNNKEAVKHVAESIRQCGYVAPIIVDENNVVLAGHTRLAALKSLGGVQTDVIVREGLTEEQKRKYRLLDNKTAEVAEWDAEKLIAELEGLDFNGFDFGFDLNALDDPDDAKEDDYDVVVPEEPKSKRGQIYKLGRHRLMCGDSTDVNDVTKLCDGNKVDLLLTDPPYGISYVGKTKDAMTIKNDALEGEEFIDFLKNAFKAADENMKPGACFYIWYADAKGWYFREACRLIDWEVRQNLIWKKNALVMGRQDYQWIHEPCLYGWKEGAGHLWASDRKQTTVLEFDRPVKSDLHPTMKPIPLFDYQMKNNTKGGDIVLDLFGGSGTTMIAAEQNGRTAYLMEYDPKFVDVIIDRWEKLTGEQAELLQ